MSVNCDFSKQNSGKKKSNDKCKPIEFHFSISYQDFTASTHLRPQICSDPIHRFASLIGTTFVS